MTVINVIVMQITINEISKVESYVKGEVMVIFIEMICLYNRLARIESVQTNIAIAVQVLSFSNNI